MISKLRLFLYTVPLLGISFAAHCVDGCPKPHTHTSKSSDSSKSCSEKCTWGLDPSFNPCSKTPGITISPTSVFLDIGQSIDIDDCDRNCCKHKYYIAGDSVNLPNYCDGAVDGHIDERVTALQAFNHDGTRDLTFAQNGILRFHNSIFGNFGANVLVKCCEDDCKNIFVVGNTSVTPSGDFVNGIVGNCDNDLDSPVCGFKFFFGPNNTTAFLGSQRFVARFECNGQNTTPNGCYVDNGNGNAVSTLAPDPLTVGNTFGSYVTKAVWSSSSCRNIIGVGADSPNLDGCGFGNPEVFKVNSDDGCSVFDTVTPVTDFIDCAATEPFGFGQFEAVTTFSNSIFAVGDADVATAFDFWPFTARGIVAKYDATTGVLDAAFGHVTIAKDGKQILLRAIATDGNSIYLGGDIADAGSGIPGGLTFPSIGAPGELVTRLSANFLIIKLNMNGTPVDIDPNLNQNTVELRWNNGTCPDQTFHAVQTDFFAGDDACFALKIDDDRLVAAGYASTGPSLEEQRPVVVRYLINDELNLDPKFNDGFVLLKDISPFRALARDLAIDITRKCHKRYMITGQAAAGPAVQTAPFSDATQTNMFVAAISRQDD